MTKIPNQLHIITYFWCAYLLIIFFCVENDVRLHVPIYYLLTKWEYIKKNPMEKNIT